MNTGKMDQKKYGQVSLIRCQYGEAVTDNATCCLLQLAHSDKEFAGYVNSNERLHRAFNLVTNSDENKPLLMETLDEADKMAVLFVEYALRTRARFAATQKYVFTKCYKQMPENATMKKTVWQQADQELKQALQLLRRLESEGAKHAKRMVSHWLTVRPDTSNDNEQDEANVAMNDYVPEVSDVEDMV